MSRPELPTERLVCGHDAADLYLLRYGELTADEETAVRRRLLECAVCAAEHGQTVTVLGSVETAPFSIDHRRAADARAHAMARIGRSSLRARWFAWSRPERRAAYWVPRFALALVLVAAGYVFGYRGTPEPAAQAAYDVRDVRVDETSGDVFVRYALPEATTLSGALDDPSVVLAVTRALAEEDDARVRLHALRAVHEARRPAAPPPDLVNAVLTVLSTSNDDALRLRAVEALATLHAESDYAPNVRGALISVLESDAGVGVRIAALDALVLRPPLPSDLERLGHVARADGNSYVRLMAAHALRSQDSAVPLESIEHD